MKSLIFLIIIIIIYYQINKRFPSKLTKKNHMYFIIFCIFYSLIFYSMKYQKPFVYKVMKNIKDVNEQPLYDTESLIYKESQREGLKNHLVMRQGWRCMSCQNPLLQKDLHSTSINYIKPLQFGGENNIKNLGVTCNTCSKFIHN